MPRPGSSPKFSVVVPAYRSAAFLADTLAALSASELGREHWELIVVDDASDDGTAAVAARFADQVISLPAPASGPARARNEGARRARGSWLLFLDADCRVRPDTLTRLAGSIESNPDAAAVFGSYDAAPAAPGLVSQYRNLFHRYVHLEGAGEANTFWAGCGAIRRDWFERLGGFDAHRFPRPQIEDIELGMRLAAAGGRIRLDPTVQVTHLKRWTLAGVIVMEIRDRGIPWTRLYLERRGRIRSLNIGPGEPLKVGLAGLTLVLAGLAGWIGPWSLLLAVPAGALLLAGWNRKRLGWFARERGWAFAIAVIPLQWLYYAGNVVSAGWGAIQFAGTRLLGQPSPSAARPVEGKQ